MVFSGSTGDHSSSQLEKPWENSFTNKMLNEPQRKLLAAAALWAQQYLHLKCVMTENSPYYKKIYSICTFLSDVNDKMKTQLEWKPPCLITYRKSSSGVGEDFGYNIIFSAVLTFLCGPNFNNVSHNNGKPP